MIVLDRIVRSRTAAALAAPHSVDHYLSRINPMWAAHEVRARVVDVRRETSTPGAPVATLTLQPTATWRGHRAGQYVQVGLDVPGAARRMTRCFSISSAASRPGEQITLTVRSHAEGQVSRRLVDAEPGRVLHLSQAQGDFTLPISPATPGIDPLLFITGGSGITPAMSMVRTLLRDGYSGRAGRPVTFLHHARSPEDQIYADELARIAADDNDVTVHLRHGDAVFNELELRRLVPRFRDTDTWACGPAGMIDLVRAAYAGSPRLRLELFKPPVSTGPTSGGISAEGDLVLAASDLQVANSGAPILEQAEALGLTPEFGCRMGICFSCTTRKAEGTVRNVLSGVESSLPDEDIQICVSAPVGDCVVDL
ncbi:oxidoreductase [Nocardioides sp. Root122]|uniref:flavin reductase family protein n=1 Tax=Nocardioides TaxID=1839 RepID=UPI00070243F0|nr:MULTISPECIES: iron-sulfur cluster-binding domain-containing protein [Nocardioides]KQV67666.1 oxidoreductase [Nocardioides sp. Root122]MCK9824112.1 iron-sulfur cluster-binding domain-containing protein [Nocardioides cavernae]